VNLRAAGACLVAGGLASAALFVPFTLAHGPTSVNLEREVAGWDMLGWGLLLGTVPVTLIALGLWRVRPELGGTSRAARTAVVTMCAVMVGFVLMNLAFRGLGPPFDLLLLAPAASVLALTARGGRARRALLVLLALGYVASVVLALVPEAASDDLSLYRVFGLVAYVAVPLLWSSLGFAFFCAADESGVASRT